LGFSSYNSSTGKSVTASAPASSTGVAVRIQTTGLFNVTGSLYSSYLVNFSALTTQNGGLGEIRVATNETDTGGDTRFRLLPDVTAGTIRPGIGYDSTPNSTTNTLSLATTYMIIGRFTNVGTTLGSGTDGIATLFALTATQWDAFITAGGTDAYLDSAVVGTGISAKASETVSSGSFAFTNGNWIQTAVSSGGSGGPQTYTYDAIRFGTTLADVAVPEPSTMLLGALAPLAFLARRKR